jgi:two-component system response regulator GlrR
MIEDRATSPASDLGQGASSDGQQAVSTAAVSGSAQPTRRLRSERTVKASANTQHALDLAGTLARSDAAVFVLGPEGSGRTHLAHVMHEWSARSSGPVVLFSTLATAEGLHGRELFGITASADPLGTGAEGALAAAAGGTLIIERVDLLPAALRDRLGQALGQGRYTRDGASEPQPLRARIMASAPLGTEASLGGQPVQTIELAALTDRREDILPLAAHFLAELAEEQGIEPVGFTVDARRWLVEEPWTGNARELRERVRQAVHLSGSAALSAEALMLSTDGDDVPSFKDAKRAFETRYVEGLLRRCGGNISRAARLAKKDRKDFYDVIRRTGVDPTEFRS